MKLPPEIKISIRILLILMILLLNWWVVPSFFCSKDYDGSVYTNAAIIYNFLTIVLMVLEVMLRIPSMHDDIGRLPIDNEINITKIDERRILIYCTLKTYFLFMIIGLFEIGLYFTINHMTSNRIGELLIFGLAFLVIFPLAKIARYSKIKSKQGYPKLKMDYKILNDRIEIGNGGKDNVIYYKDFTSVIKYNNLIFIEAKNKPENIIITGANNAYSK